MATLDAPLSLPCGQTLPNRLMKSALSEGLGTAEFGPGDRLSRLYARWGAGGFGLIVTGNVMVDRDHLGEPGNVVIEDDRHLAALTEWARGAQAGGARVWAQLNHPGRQANPLVSGNRPVAPSAVGLGVPGMPAPRALTDDEVDRIVDRFATAAAVCEAAGFDGVQIHAAHGYLVSQFLSPLTNRRDDRWGGDPQRRMGFLLAIIERIRAKVAPGFAVGIKLNSADFQRGGFTEDESRALIEQLAGEPIDLIEITGGSYESPAMMGRPVARAASTVAREAYFLDYARSARRVAGAIPLAVTGGFRSRTAMVEAVESGACDLVGLGRPTAVSPAAGHDILTGRVERLHTPTITLGLPARLAKIPQVKSLEGAVDLQWHGVQLHRMGRGEDPDLRLAPWRTALTLIRRNGLEAFRSRRQSRTATR